MKKENYKGKAASELIELVGKRREELRAMRFDIAGSRGKNTKAIRELRRDTARALTELSLLAPQQQGKQQAAH